MVKDIRTFDTVYDFENDSNLGKYDLEAVEIDFIKQRFIGAGTPLAHEDRLDDLLMQAVKTYLNDLSPYVEQVRQEEGVVDRIDLTDLVSDLRNHTLDYLETVENISFLYVSTEY